MGLLSRALRFLPVAALAALPLLGSAACGAELATVLSSDAGTDSATPPPTGGASCATDPECNEDSTLSSLKGRCVQGVCVCNAGTTGTSSGKCGSSGTTDGGTSSCVANGGVCLKGESAPPPNHRPATAGEGTCTGDAVCWVPIQADPHVCSANYECNGDIGASAIWGTCFHGICVCDAAHVNQPDGRCNAPPAPSCAAQNGTCRHQPAVCLAGEIGSSISTDMSCGDLVPAICCNQASACVGPSVDFLCCMPNGGEQPPICVNGWRTCPSGASAVETTGGCI